MQHPRLTRLEVAAVLSGNVQRLVRLGVEPQLALRAVAREHGLAPAHARAMIDELDAVFHAHASGEVA